MLPSLGELIGVCAGVGAFVGLPTAVVAQFGDDTASLRKDAVDFAQLGAACGSGVALVMWAVGKVAGG